MSTRRKKPTVAKAPATAAPTVVAEPQQRRIPEAPPPEGLTLADLFEVQRLVKEDALRKFLRGHVLVFEDACKFWGVAADAGPIAIRAKERATATFLKKIVDWIDGDGPGDPRLPSLSTCYGLFNLNRLMGDKFKAQLEPLTEPPPTT